MLDLGLLVHLLFRYDQGWVVEMVDNIKDLRNAIILAKKVYLVI